MSDRYRVLVTGSRNLTDYELVKQWILYAIPEEWLPEDVDIIHGDARGADRLAGKVAHEFGMLERAFPADWDKYGKAAGYQRNSFLLEQEPDVVVGFPLPGAKGTWDMLKKAVDAGVETVVVYGGNK